MSRHFGEDLALSHGDRQRWDRFYRSRYPDCEIINGEKSPMLQGLGADVILKRPNGKQILVEEKARTTAFCDCLIEIWSVFYGDDDPRNVPGWSVHPDKHAEWLAYAVRPLGRCWLLPFGEYRAFACEIVRGPHVTRQSFTVAKDGKRWSTLHTSVEWAEVYHALRLSAADVCFEW